MFSDRSTRVEAAPRNNPGKPLFTKKDAYTAGASLLTTGLQGLAQGAANDLGVNINPTVNPDSESFLSRIYGVFSDVGEYLFGSEEVGTSEAEPVNPSNTTEPELGAEGWSTLQDVPEVEVFDVSEGGDFPSGGASASGGYDQVAKLIEEMDAKLAEQRKHHSDQHSESRHHHHRHHHHRPKRATTINWDEPLTEFVRKNATEALCKKPEHKHDCLQVNKAGYLKPNWSGFRQAIKIENNCQNDYDVRFFPKGPKGRPINTVSVQSGEHKTIARGITNRPLQYSKQQKGTQKSDKPPKGYDLHCLRSTHRHGLSDLYPKEEMLMFSKLASYAYSRDSDLLTGNWTVDPTMGQNLADGAGISFDSTQNIINDQSSGLIAIAIKRQTTDGKEEYGLIFGGTASGLSSTGSLGQRATQKEVAGQLGANISAWGGGIPLAYQYAKRLVILLAKASDNENGQAYVTGHSLGGGLCSYAVGVARSMGYNVQGRTFASAPINRAMREEIAQNMQTNNLCTKVENLADGIKEVHVQGDVVPGVQNPHGSLNVLGQVYEIVPEGGKKGPLDAHSGHGKYIAEHDPEKWLNKTRTTTKQPQTHSGH